MKKTIISCVLFLTAVTAFSQTTMKTAAEAKLSASDLAVKIADRILATTTYEFKNAKTGKTYKSVKNLPLDMNVKVACKYNNWHYTNGVTHIALMELADKTGAKKYDDYVFKNMNFVFNEGNLDFFKKQYDQAMKDEGWYGVRK